MFWSIQSHIAVLSFWLSFTTSPDHSKRIYRCTRIRPSVPRTTSTPTTSVRSYSLRHRSLHSSPLIYPLFASSFSSSPFYCKLYCSITCHRLTHLHLSISNVGSLSLKKLHFANRLWSGFPIGTFLSYHFHGTKQSFKSSFPISSSNSISQQQIQKPRK